MTSELKVLLIDDDPDFTASLTTLLESRGYAVVEANSAASGLSKIVEHNPDVIVLDIMMDTTSDGYGVNAAIKHEERYREYRETPIIMVSAIQTSPEERFPMAAERELISPDYYFSKPLDVPRFLKVLESAVARRERQTV